MNLIEHPEAFKLGTRIIMLRGRPKDGVPTNRSTLRIVHGPEQFDRRLDELVRLADDGERIYASAGPRDVRKASRIFRERQVAADYDADPVNFYMNIESRWASCVQAVGAQAEKLWLFDCDTDEDQELVEDEIEAHYDRPVDPYWYETKNGHHCVVQPFNKSLIDGHARSLIHDNAIILWGW